jgi:hypothetical protein
VTGSTFAVGSIDALRALVAEPALLGLTSNDDVIVVPTAAAFTGMTESAMVAAAVFESSGVRVEALMAGDRAALRDPYFARRVSEANLVVITDGSPLHARSVWRDSPFGEALGTASTIVAIGSVSTVLCEVMIDPRGGAPTTGLAYRSGAALCLAASDEQMLRTRSLLSSDVALVTIGLSGIVQHDANGWRALRGEVIVTRGQDPAEL